jgi:phosphoserine phosphatase
LSVPDIDGLVGEVEFSPEGPEIGAFFDFDGTLIDGYSAVAYFRDRLLSRRKIHLSISPSCWRSFR